MILQIQGGLQSTTIKVPLQYFGAGPNSLFVRNTQCSKFLLFIFSWSDDPEAPPRLRKLPPKKNHKPHISELIFLKEDTYSTYVENESKREYMEKEVEQ